MGNIEHKGFVSGIHIELPRDLLKDELVPSPHLLSEMPRHNVLATTTLYRTNDIATKPEIATRAQLALTMFEKACSLGYEMISVDGGSDAGWKKKAQDLGVCLENECFDDIPGHHPMGKSKRQAMRLAADLGKPLMTWLEPEKHPYILARDGQSPVAMAAAPVYEGAADAVLPRRINTSCYPGTQQAIELFCNLMVMNLMHTHFKQKGLSQEEIEKRVPYLDQWSGPRTFHANFARYYTHYSGEIRGFVHDRWESLNAPIWQMMLEGKRVRGVAVPYEHPREQTLQEGANISYDLKRLEQAQYPLQALSRLLGMDVSPAA